MFNGLLEEILNESTASIDKIVKAMDNHEKILVTYRPVSRGHEQATGTRLIGIFALGQTKAGNMCVRVYEYAGDTATFVPAWKILRLDQFLSWKNTGQQYFEAPNNKFNPNGDKTMSNVLKIVSFNDESIETKDNETGPVTNDKPFQTDTEKALKQQGKRLRNQLDNPINISDFKAREGAKPYEGGKNEYTEGPKTNDDTTTTTTPLSYKDEVSKRFQGLKDKLENAPKIDLSQFENEKKRKIHELRRRLSGIRQPISLNELKVILQNPDLNSKLNSSLSNIIF